MPMPARNTLAVIGAGPIGLEAAVAALDRGLDVHVFERGEAGSHPIAWGHVRMFTPWRMNLGAHGRAHLEATGWGAPQPEVHPTGLEYAEQYLQPLAGLPELKDRVHTHAQVVQVSRRGLLQTDAIGRPERREHPFRLLVRDHGGRESLRHVFAVIDASGVYGQPNWAGDGGIPARGELYLAPQMSYHVDDVLGLRRARYAGRRTLVIGAGASGATVVSDLARLADEAPGTSVAWATRESADCVCPEIADDPLAERRTLFTRARGLVHGAHPAVGHIGGAWVEAIDFNSATHRYRVTLTLGEQARVEEVDQVVVNTGYGPDHSICRELQIHECHAWRGPMKLPEALPGAEGGVHPAVPASGAEALAHPEPDFYILGHKSCGRSGGFLLESGFRQVADVVETLARGLQVSTPA